MAFVLIRKNDLFAVFFHVCQMLNLMLMEENTAKFQMGNNWITRAVMLPLYMSVIFFIPTEKLSPLCNLLHIYISWKWKGQSYGKYHKVELFHYLLKLLHEMLVYMYYGTSILKHYLQSLLTFLRKFCALLNNPKSFHFKTRNKHIFLAI